MNYAGVPAYNPLNKWNYGNNATPDVGGAVHLTSPPNTVGAEIYLGAAATILRALGPGQYSPANNICLSLYGGSFRNSDPNIGMQANQVTRNLKMRLSLTNPIALYMQTPDFSNYTAPHGHDPASFFKIVRGKTAKDTGRQYDEILHATYEVPAELGFTVSDIRIGGRNILYGAQMAETFNQALAATAYPKMALEDGTFYPAVGDRDSPNGQAQQPITLASYEAVTDSPTISAATIPVLPPAITAGTNLNDMALIVTTGSAQAEIEYVGPDGKTADGIKVIRNGSITEGSQPRVGKEGIYDVIVYKISLHIANDVAPGLYGVRVTNPGNLPAVPTPETSLFLPKRPTNSGRDNV